MIVQSKHIIKVHQFIRSYIENISRIRLFIIYISKFLNKLRHKEI